MSQVTRHARDDRSVLATCRANQIEAGLAILLGHPDQRGARLGLSDWFAEEYLIEQAAHDAGKEAQDA